MVTFPVIKLHCKSEEIVVCFIRLFTIFESGIISGNAAGGFLITNVSPSYQYWQQLYL